MTGKIHLKEQGLTETTPRFAVLKVMGANKNQHLSAEDIYRYLLEHKRLGIINDHSGTEAKYPIEAPSSLGRSSQTSAGHA